MVYHGIARGKTLTPECPPHEKVERWGLKLSPQVLSGPFRLRRRKLSQLPGRNPGNTKRRNPFASFNSSSAGDCQLTFPGKNSGLTLWNPKPTGDS